MYNNSSRSLQQQAGKPQRRTYLHRVVAAVFPPADKRHKLHTPSASLQQRLRETKAASTGLLSSSQCLWRSAGSLLANALLTTTGLTMPAMHFGFCHAPVAPLLLLRLCVAVWQCTYLLWRRTAGSRAGSIGCRCLMRDDDLKSHRVNLPRKQVLKWVLFFLAHTCVRHQLQTA